MPRYVSRPRASRMWDDTAPEGQSAPLEQPRVHGGEPVPTGLVDQHGYDICRLPDPVGFVRWRER
jgi:hypothetical protein